MFKKYHFVVLILFISIVLISGCSSKKTEPVFENSVESVFEPVKAEFTGEKGEQVEFVNGEIVLDKDIFDDNQAHFYNSQLNNKTIYFFVVKDKSGIYRAAANACQVCASSMRGFRQEGDFMVCNTCGNKYPLEKIATEKGGCNPVPINPNLEIRDNKVVVQQTDLTSILSFF